MDSVKQCSRCRIKYPATAAYFNRSKRTKDGLFCYCKKCDKARVDQWKKDNPEKLREQKRKWARTNPESVTNARRETYSKNRERWNAERVQRYANDHEYREKQKESVAAAYEKHGERYYRQVLMRYRSDEQVRRSAVDRTKLWRAENPEAVRVYSQKRRARLASAPGCHKPEDIRLLLIEQDGKCVYCRCDITEGKHTIEHLIPLSRGGSNGPENIALACSRCNAMKGAKTVPEFLTYLGELHG